MTPHISAKLDDIASLVLISGDPIRVAQMSKQFLKKNCLVSNVRNLAIYTGYYKGIRITFATSGIGQASIGIVAYELLKYYQVKVIIRLGTCGLFALQNYQLRDLFCVDTAYSFTTFFPEFYQSHKIVADSFLNNLITQSAQKQKINLYNDIKIWSSNEFYFQDASSVESLVKIYDLIGTEMEAYTLFVLAKLFHARAACLLTVSDIIKLPSSFLSSTEIKNNHSEKNMTTQERTSGLTKSFLVILEALVKFYHS